MDTKVLAVVLGVGLVFAGQTVVSAGYDKAAPAAAAMAEEAQAGMDVVKEDMNAMKEDVQAVVEEVAPVAVNNKVCPVEGGPIEEGKSVKVTHNGKEYNLCCAACVKAFNEDPDKFSAKADEAMMHEGAMDAAGAAVEAVEKAK